MNDEAEPQHYLTRNWKPVSIVTLIGLIPALIATNAWYVNYHDTRYILRAEAMTLAAAESLTSQVDIALEQGVDNSKKLDFLLIQAAQREVYDAEIALQEIDKNSEQTLQWHDMKRDAVKRLDTARALLVCFRSGSVDCDNIRGF